MSYRVQFGGGARVQFHSLPEHARDALVACAAELAGQPWDAVIRPPGDDPRFREAVFGSGSGILGFYLDEVSTDAQVDDGGDIDDEDAGAGESPAGGVPAGLWCA